MAEVQPNSGDLRVVRHGKSRNRLKNSRRVRTRKMDLKQLNIAGPSQAEVIARLRKAFGVPGP